MISVSAHVPTEYGEDPKFPWYRLLTVREAYKLPWGWKEKRLGHLYFAVLSTGNIKIGSTRTPGQRVRQHTLAIRSFTDAEVEAFYFTAPHTNYRENESAIHAKLPRPDAHKGRAIETYRGLSVSDAVAMIHSCRFENVQMVSSKRAAA